MKVLDRYIIRELFVPILYCVLSLVFLILIADLFDNLDEFLRYKTPISILLKYYASLTPYAFTQIIPWATWLGTLFLLVNFGFHNETLAMKVSGLKISTIVRPILFLGFLIGILTFVVSDRVVPVTYRTASELSDIYISQKTEAGKGKVLHNVTFHSGHKNLYYIRTLFITKGEAKDIIILWLDTKSGDTKQKISAENGVWRDGYWELRGITEYQIDSRGHILGDPRTFAVKDYPDLDVSPNDLSNASRESIFLTYRQMKYTMRQLSSTGASVQSEMVDLQYRLASPWQSLVMMLIAIPLLGPTRTRKGIAAYVLVCVIIILAYQVTGAVSLALGKSGRLLPFVSAWAANIIFSVAALFYLDKANY